MADQNPLGEYLRKRRELIRPDEVGLPPGVRRKVPGLRREELALLSGISADYYLRLEQGRDRHPSIQILDALARTLQLDADAIAYLHELAAPRPRVRAARPVRHPPAGIAQLVEQMPMPVIVQNKYGDVLAANPLAGGLSPHYRPGVNLVRAVFLEPQDRELRPDWDRATTEAVAGLRAASAADVDDPRLAALVGELSLRSERFRTLWARHDVRRRVGGTSRFNHPQVGPMELHHEKLHIAGSDGLVMVVYHAEPGTITAEALALLGTIAVSVESHAASPTSDQIHLQDKALNRPKAY